MCKQIQLLEELKALGFSSPAGIHWERLCQTILKYANNPLNEKLPNPLILGGSIASHSAKHERLSAQLDWADKHGCINEAIKYLKLISEDQSKWNVSNGDDWGREHPWTTDGFD